jgi:uncharacterized protein (DUF2235 family)
MARNLALFFDGTWNTPGSETNVVRLFRLTAARHAFRGHLLRGSAIKDEAHSSDEANQLKYYHKGVGTTWRSWFLGGMFGSGLSKNIRDGLEWLSTHYRPDDQIFLFGFSRGAYTARSLVGLIRKCGVPKWQDGVSTKTSIKGLVATAYHIYREGQWSVDGTQADCFRRTFSWPNLSIKFVGVWDTVGALGLPMHEILFGSDFYRFHDTQLSGIVANAFHAIAIDEHRPDFAETMWDVSKAPSAAQRVEQRWFPGAHADVGGGYKNGKLYQAPLRWMRDRAEECGLVFKAKIEVDSDAHLSLMHDSFHECALGLYANLPWVFENRRSRGTGVNESVDASALARIASPEGYDAFRRRYSPWPDFPPLGSHSERKNCAQ